MGKLGSHHIYTQSTPEPGSSLCLHYIALLSNELVNTKNASLFIFNLIYKVKIEIEYLTLLNTLNISLCMNKK